MHLHQLKIKNLASLKGEHIINFDENHSGHLFTITGETGSGKSTLLNALALALFGKVYKRGMTQADLVTLGERDALVEATFSTRGKKYLAFWSIVVRKKDGALLSPPRPERFFYEVQNESARVLDIEAGDVLKLDFDQFCKSVVLNQGEFSRFLNATFGERKEILERLYSSDNLDRLSGLAKRKWEVSKENLGRLEVQIFSISEENLFDRALQEKKINELSLMLAQQSEQLTCLHPWLHGLTEMQGLAQKYEKAQEGLKSATEQSRERTQLSNDSMQAWKTHQERLTLLEQNFEGRRPELEKDQIRAQKLSELNVELTQKKRFATEIEAQILSTQKELNSHQEKMQDSMKSCDQIKLAFPLIRDWDAFNWDQLRELQVSAPLIKVQSQETLKRIDDLNHQIHLKTQSLEGLQKSILDLSLPPELTVAQTRPQAIKDRRERLAYITRQETEFLKHQTQFDEVSKKLRGTIGELKTLETEILQLEISKIQESRKVLSELKLLDKLDVCPLCDSPHTPQDGHQTPATVVRSHETISRLLHEKTRLEMSLGDLEAKIAAHSPLERPIKELEAQHNEIETQLTSLSRIEVQVTEAYSSLEDLKAQVSKEHVRLSGLKGQHTRFTELQKEIEEKLSSLGHPTPWSDALPEKLIFEKNQAHLLQDREQHLKMLQKLVQDSQMRAQELEGKRKMATSELAKLTEASAAETNALKALYPEAGPMELLKSLQQEIRQASLKNHTLLEEYRSKEQLLAESRAQLGRVEEQIKQLQLLFSEAREKLRKIHPLDLNVEDSQVLLAALVKKHQDEVLELQNSVKSTQAQLSQIQTLLQEDDRRQARLIELKAQHQKAHEEVVRWERVNDVLGQDEMRTFALSLVEGALVHQTNSELEKLCSGRYEIQHTQRGMRPQPEFWVIDRWRDGLKRKVSTLSGGETFMVSLAMAVALADLTQGQADIDCFFIDEGFGTLDQDSLEDVVGMLQNLEARGKQIGLITHVPYLSSRFAATLRLEKNQYGHSKTEWFYN